MATLMARHVYDLSTPLSCIKITLYKNRGLNGDSVHDIGSAKDGGLRIIAVATGKHTVAELEEKHPEMVLPNLQVLM